MQGASSADAPAARADQRGPTPAAGELPLSTWRRAAMIGCGFIPFVHAACTVLPAALVWAGAARPYVLLSVPAVLYLAPAIVVRIATWARPLDSGAFPVSSSAFLWWWFTAQFQVLFSRLPLLEELLRTVPGLYSVWLRIWGARVGGLVYWSPGVAITDRSLLRIGDRVVFGMGARLNAHVLAPGSDRTPHLYLAPISVGSDAIVGGYSLLLAGCEIGSGEITPPLRTLHPFTSVSGGRRRAVAGSPMPRPQKGEA